MQNITYSDSKYEHMLYREQYYMSDMSMNDSGLERSPSPQVGPLDSRPLFENKGFSSGEARGWDPRFSPCEGQVPNMYESMYADHDQSVSPYSDYDNEGSFTPSRVSTLHSGEYGVVDKQKFCDLMCDIMATIDHKFGVTTHTKKE